MRFAVDPWDPSYGSSVDAELGASTADVDPDVEMSAGHWEPVPPPPSLLPPPAVLFVDGVRRIDAQVWLDEGGTVSPALCASYAAGVVCSCDGGAHLLSARVKRGLVTTAADAEGIVTAAGTYEVVAAREDRGTAPLLLALQNDLGAVELAAAATARESHGADGDLLVVDGPLRGRRHLPRAIGFVKSHRSTYLDPGPSAVVGRLAAAERTPLFRIEHGHPRYTWYLRLPCPPGAPWAGVVRVECGGELPRGEAVLLADLSQVALPRYASAAYKDSRAPQNLYPIAGLERALRRRLGEPAVLYRGLRRAADQARRRATAA